MLAGKGDLVGVGQAWRYNRLGLGDTAMPESLRES